MLLTERSRPSSSPEAHLRHRHPLRLPNLFPHLELPHSNESFRHRTQILLGLFRSARPLRSDLLHRLSRQDSSAEGVLESERASRWRGDLELFGAPCRVKEARGEGEGREADSQDGGRLAFARKVDLAIVSIDYRHLSLLETLWLMILCLSMLAFSPSASSPLSSLAASAVSARYRHPSITSRRVQPEPGPPCPLPLLLPLSLRRRHPCLSRRLPRLSSLHFHQLHASAHSSPPLLPSSVRRSPSARHPSSPGSSTSPKPSPRPSETRRERS
jgi:hypothetical protein